MGTERDPARTSRPDADLPWQVRLEWESKAPVVHPRFTYEGRDSEDDALFCARCALRWSPGGNPRIAAAYVCGPSVEEWRPVTLQENVRTSPDSPQHAEEE